MAATDIDIRWDEASGSEVMIAVREAGYYVRCGRVLGLTNANTTSETALTDVVVASGQVPYTHPDARLINWKLRYAIVRGDSQTTGLVWAHYAPLQFAGSPIEKLAIEAGGAIEYEPSERMWDTGHSFKVKLPGDTPETTVTVDETLDTADADVSLQTLAFPRVTKVLSLYGLFANVPRNLEKIENAVNDSAWPAASPGAFRMGLRPRGIGYWKADPVRVRWSQRDGLYAVAVTLASRGILPGEDWSTYKFAQDPTTGKFLAPSAAMMNALLSLDYQYDIVNNVGGVLKVGLYHLAPFAAVLNPILQNSPLSTDTPFNPLGI